ncbi:mycothiol conjugate amidase Mca [Mycetocola reblochoni]|nr:mycothiol conjugate amidase Mca [Mycetocola reblochoni]
MTVHAHPDDESSKGAATLAYYRSRGADVLVVSCTGGERGDILNPAVEATPLASRDLAGLRRREMDAARDILGVRQRWLGYRDSGMANENGSVPAASFADIPVETSVLPLVALIREQRPQVLISYDENGGYPHPDHIRSNRIAVRARELAGSDDHPELGDPWSVPKHYYDRVFSSERFRAIVGAMIARFPDAPERGEWEELLTRFTEREDALTERVLARVPVADFFEVRDNALRAHASQVSPESSFFFWPNDLQREVWPTEDYELIHSTVPSAPVGAAESDLFNGIEDSPA